MNYYKQATEPVEVFNSTSEILKLVARKKNKAHGRRLYCFHSWRAVISGTDHPLDESELALFQGTEGAMGHIHLVSGQNQVDFIHHHLGTPAVVLPYTVFQDESIYQNLGIDAEYDVVFSSMYTPEHFARKRVDLLFDFMREYPHIRVLFLGGYDPYERWCMEHAFNLHFAEYGAPPANWGALWSEKEAFLCWYNGAKVFRDEIEKHQFLQGMIEVATTENLNIQFYMNLSREQVVHALNRCRAALSLASLDQWPRAITEALACGTPVVCMKDLLSGKQLISNATGVVAEPHPASIYAAIRNASLLNRSEVREAYLSEWGMGAASRKLLGTVAQHYGDDWDDIVSIQRPAETRLKDEVRRLISPKP